MIFKNKTAMITGGGRGIGLETAYLLASCGARVVVMSQTFDEIKSAAEKIQAMGGESLALQGDVGSESDVIRVFAEVEKKWGGIDILVNNAAVAINKHFLELSNEDWQKSFQVNIMGLVHCSREAFIQMKKRGGGTIVNVSSLGGLERLQKFEGFSAYSMSKSGVVGITECLAVEGKSLGITVNCVAPGAVDTLMLKQVAPFFKTSTKPNDVARVIKFLCEEGLQGKMSGSVFPLFTNG